MICNLGRRSYQCIVVVFKFEFLILMLSLNRVSEAQTVSLRLCSPPIKGTACQLSCTTTDQTEDITFASNGNVRGSCGIAFGSPSCGANTAQPSATTTTFDIASLSRTTDNGPWTCTYGSAPGVIDTQTLTVLTYPTTPSSTDITHSNGMITNLRTSSSVSMAFTMDCTYPQPSVMWNFRACGGSILISKGGTVTEDTSASNICVSPEKNFLSTTSISSDDINNSAEQCLQPEVEIKVNGFTAHTVTASYTITFPESEGLSGGAIAGIGFAVAEIMAAVVLAILWRMKLLCFKEPRLGCGDKAGIVIAVLLGVVVIPAVVIVILWKMKKLCFKVPTEEKPTGSTNSGTPMVENSNVTNSKVDTTENSKDPILDIDNKKRHTGVEPLTERSEGQPEINQKKTLPSIGQ